MQFREPWNMLVYFFHDIKSTMLQNNVFLSNFGLQANSVKK
jgi:hypothetical protein